MPRTITKVNFPAKEIPVVTEVTCDICGAKAPEIDFEEQEPNWSEESETKIVIKRIENTDTNITVKTWYLCPSCFDKIFSQYPPSVEDSW